MTAQITRCRKIVSEILALLDRSDSPKIQKFAEPRYVKRVGNIYHVDFKDHKAEIKP